MNPITEVKIGAALLLAVMLFLGGLMIGYKYGHGAAEKMALQNQKSTILEYETRLKDQNTIFSVEQAKLQLQVSRAQAATAKWMADNAALQLNYGEVNKQIGEIRNEKLRPATGCRDTIDFERLYNAAARGAAMPAATQARQGPTARGVHGGTVGPAPRLPERVAHKLHRVARARAAQDPAGEQGLGQRAVPAGVAAGETLLQCPLITGGLTWG